MLEKLKFLTAGESHGKGLLGIIDGIPAGLEISEVVSILVIIIFDKKKHTINL